MTVLGKTYWRKGIKMRTVHAFLWLVAVVLTLSTSIFAASYGGGAGTPENPYQIWMAEEIITIGQNPGDWNKSFKLMDNIDFSGVSYSLVYAIGNFSGTFDGSGYTISNYQGADWGRDNVGIFRCLYRGGKIKNLGLINAKALGRSVVGSLVAENQGTITSCYAVKTDSCGSNSSIGGLVGRNMGVISDCYVSGDIGGCGPLTAQSVGGLVGWNSGTIINSYATDVVKGMDSVGGLVGSNNNGTITYCYSTGKISGNGSLGGLVGQSSSGSISSCFWDIQTSGLSISAGGTGLTTEQMKDTNTYLSAGWDLMNNWWIPDNDYPWLRWQYLALQKYSGGSGTTDDPYQISTFDDWREFMASSADWDKHFVLTNDIDLLRFAITPVAPDMNASMPGFQGTEFTGVLDGNGHIIRNVSITQPGNDYVGLFGKIGSGGLIKTLAVENANFQGRDYVGGLVGLNYYGTIKSCYAFASVCRVDSGVMVGVLAGGNSGVISNSYAIGYANSRSCVGGLVGGN
jgi:hypothetical protein